MILTLLYWKHGHLDGGTKRFTIYVGDVPNKQEKNIMTDPNGHFEHHKSDAEMERELNQTKTLSLSKNESFFLSDTFTLLIEYNKEDGIINLPVRGVLPSAGVPVPIEMIERVGLAVLETTDPKNTTQTAEVDFTVSELFLMRECCQSYISVDNEAVGYNLVRKIYRLLLEDTLLEKRFIDTITKDIKISLVEEERKDANTTTNNDRTGS